MSVLSLLVAALLQATGSPSALVIGGDAPGDCFAAAASPINSVDDLVQCERAVTQVGLSGVERAASYVNYGIVLRRRGRLDEALEAYGRALELAPALAEAYLNRASARSSLGRDFDALADLDQALRLELGRPEVAHFNRALIYERQDRIEDAFAELQAALAVNPEYAPALQALARYRVEAG